MEDLFNIKEKTLSDDFISQYEIHNHTPFTTSFGSNDEIRIAIQHQSQCLLPSKSFLRVQGKFSRENGEAVIAGTTLVNNFICHLFSEIRYELNSITIDKCKNPALTTLMKGYPSFSPTQINTLENAGWTDKNE